MTGVEKVVRIREELFFARLDCFVDLGRDQKGAHMSRFDEVVNEAIGEVVLSESPFRAETLAQHIAELVRERQGAERAEVTIAARYPEHKPAPVSGVQTQEIYTLLGRAVAFEHGTRGTVGVSATGMTACPCAQELVAARARERLAGEGFDEEQIERILASVPSRRTTSAAWPRCRSAAPRSCARRSTRARCCAIAEASMSSEIYELMKRSDEVEVVEKAHRRPRFVEDCVREMIAGVVARVPRARRRELRLRAPGEPRDDPPAQRRRRAPRPALSELRGEIELGRAGAAPDEPRGVARRRRARGRASARRPGGRSAPAASAAAHARRSSRGPRDRHGDGHVEQRVDPQRLCRGTAITARIAAICRHVLTLPNMLAGITTPACVAPIRSTVTASSRVMITIATHAAQPVQRHERDQRGDDQQLVRERVHQLAERRHRVARAREVAVDEVRQRGEREHDRREHVAVARVAEQRHDQHRHEHDPQHRQHVGEVQREHAPVAQLRRHRVAHHRKEQRS